VVYDEIDLPFGAIRLREKGGSGGHNGMKSIIAALDDGFPRLRLGIGRPPGRMDPAAYVLQNFQKEELPVIEEIIDRSISAIETYLTDGIEITMTRFNISSP
jgi:PTH1 family peptidyl-tRNA hydrolase